MKAPLYRVELGRVGRKAQELYIIGAHYLFRAMTRSTIEYDEQMMIGVGFGDLFEERLQAPTVHPRKIKTEALSRCGFDCRVEVGPLVGAPEDVGWRKPLRTISPPVPVDEAKTRFIKGQNLSGFLSESRWPSSLSLSAKFFESLLLF